MIEQANLAKPWILDFLSAAPELLPAKVTQPWLHCRRPQKHFEDSEHAEVDTWHTAMAIQT